MLRIGLTGGIASGKSTVAALFAARGVPVLDSDQIARDVVAPGSPGLAAIVRRFGSEILLADGSLDRRQLRERVFADAAARADLEAITHPLIRARMQELAATAQGPYQIHMIPLLAEGNGRSRFDRVLVVDCPESVQIERVMQRDQVDADSARKILAAQAPRAVRLEIADDVIVNDGHPEHLVAAVDELHRRYIQLSVYDSEPAPSQ